MKAIAINQFGGPEVLEIMDPPKPKIGKGELLIEVKAAGVNPVDWKIREGLLKGRLPYQLPITLGWDAAGVVTETGEGVKDPKVGDEIFAYCRKETIQEGSFAEYITLTPEHCAIKPKNLSFEEAAAVPLASLTAYQALFESIKIQSGEKILIHAGAGGVGGFAIQLAKNAGAYVITTASAGKHDYVKDLGADEVIDYQTNDFVEVIQEKYPEGIEAVLDSLGGEIQIKSTKVLKKGGRITAILAVQEEIQKIPDIEVGYVFVRPESSQLTKIKEMIEEGKIEVSLAAIFPLEEASKALEMLKEGHVAGKIVLQVS